MYTHVTQESKVGLVSYLTLFDTADKNPSDEFIQALKMMFSAHNPAKILVIDITHVTKIDFVKSFFRNYLSDLLKLKTSEHINNLVVITTNKIITKVGTTLSKLNGTSHKVKFVKDPSEFFF